MSGPPFPATDSKLDSLDEYLVSFVVAPDNPLITGHRLGRGRRGVTYQECMHRTTTSLLQPPLFALLELRDDSEMLSHEVLCQLLIGSFLRERRELADTRLGLKICLGTPAGQDLLIALLSFAFQDRAGCQ